MAISAGTIITDGKNILVGRNATKKRWWDIPKGGVDKGEKFKDAAKRELKEETGIKMKRSKFKRIGLFPYKPNKRMYLFIIKDKNITKKINPNSLRGEINPKLGGPELDKFKFIPISKIRGYLPPKLATLVLSVLDI